MCPRSSLRIGYLVTVYGLRGQRTTTGKSGQRPRHSKGTEIAELGTPLGKSHCASTRLRGVRTKWPSAGRSYIRIARRLAGVPLLGLQFELTKKIPSRNKPGLGLSAKNRFITSRSETSRHPVFVLSLGMIKRTSWQVVAAFRGNNLPDTSYQR